MKGKMMVEESQNPRRVVFYGVGDLAAGLHAARVAGIVTQFDPADAPTDITDVLELHHAQLYLEHGILPRNFTVQQVREAQAQAPHLRGAIARFFSTIDHSNVATVVVGVGREYHQALLDLLGRSKAFERCDAARMLGALRSTGVSLGAMLASKRLVQAYDAAVRAELRADVKNAEYVVSKYLYEGGREDIYLPPSFTPADARTLMDHYVEGADANPNHVSLIESAPVSIVSGIDAKLKLKAKRRRKEMNEEFFKANAGMRTGVELSISPSQSEPVRVDAEEMVMKVTISARWLEETTDYPSILNNVQHLFEFVDSECLLTLPAYPAGLGVMERLLGMKGKTDYHTGISFRIADTKSLLEVRMLRGFLKSKGIDLEQVLSWFFGEYLAQEFGAENFSFAPTGDGTTYLQKVRHLFAEMESVANQFALYVQDGELDRELLAMTANQVRYRLLPTLVEGKYLYATDEDEINNVLHLLFSDQSRLNYINADLSEDSAAHLLIRHKVAYADFEEYQKGPLDYLLSLGLLRDDGARVQIADAEQYLILRSLSYTGAASYYRLSPAGRAVADAMVSRGWAVRRSTLLSEPEAKYFNYFLNNVDFSNGPQLRNKYAHGSQPDSGGEDAYYRDYLIALRLILALVIKINDDFCLAEQEAIGGDPGDASGAGRA
ncbi:hypothetical protein [Cellulomonas xiejunii]|uniref:hypothetical protein n=1 Tax=Cellulomonas xiejunii TaxID=2968083 RepID=UPI001D0E8DE6|nr:hypothetical protein [Cellulomonas xiejunii]MCC2315612.1 hypothetical protein [Cellulomonas xiejunii]